jgi:hypothetical protein
MESNSDIQTSFVTALTATSIQEGIFVDGTRTYGENGCPQYSDKGVDDPRVGLFNALVRKCDFERVHAFVERIVRLWKKKDDIQILVDLCVLPFQTRAIRGPGKGERDLFYFMLISLNEHFPTVVNELLEIVPFYGSFKDYFRLMEVIEEQKSGSNMNDRIIELVAKQLIEDYNKFLNANVYIPQYSLCAKWAPREGKHFDTKLKVVGKLCEKIFPEDYGKSIKQTKKALMKYRKMISKLTKELNVTEIYMTAKKWAEINFKNVPSRCLKVCRKGFLNEALKKKLEYNEMETGNRFPEDVDRVECRKHLIEFMKNPEKVKSNAVFPHEIIREFWNDGNNHSLSTTEKMLLEIAFENIVTNTRETIEKAKQEKPPVIDMSNMISMIDVSGSMNGEPIEVAIALGIITGELVNDSFKKKGITFSAHPTFIDWNRCPHLEDTVELIRHAQWDMNTNFEKAIDLIIQTARDHKLSRDQIPNILVLSDMQFDIAVNGSSYYNRNPTIPTWETMHEHIISKFKALGMELVGTEWEPPLIFYWNLRGDTNGAPVNSNTEGTAMLSGFSPSLLQLILSGDLPVELEDQTDPNSAVRVKITPYDMFRKAVDHTFYDLVRRKLSEISIEPFELYDIA